LEAAERSVVRVIAISLDESGQVSDVDEGSGFFVAPGKVITNNHVVAGAAGASRVRVFVIPERDTGERREETVATATWPQADLALLSVPAIAAPALAIATAVPGKDSTVHALGYPGVTDAMRQLPLEEILAPSEPYVTPGAVALTSRTAPGGGAFETLFHTAPINPGNSGGPLIDACGRVIGVNAWEGASALAANGEVATYQGQFAAVESSVLARFLSREGVAVAIDSSACTPPMDAAVAARLAAAETAIASEAKARGEAEARFAARAERDRKIIIAIVALVALAAVGLTVLTVWRGRDRGERRDAPPAVDSTSNAGNEPLVSTSSRSSRSGVPAAAVVGLVAAAMILAAGIAWLLADAGGRRDSISPTRASVPSAPAPSLSARFEVTCQGVPAESSIGVNAPTTGFTIEPARACVNGRTPYEKTPASFSRVMTNDAAGVVSTLTISADLTRFERRDHALTADRFASLRAALGTAAAPRCDAAQTPRADAAAQSRLAAIRAASAPYMSAAPTRRMTWRCTAVPWR